MSDAIALPRELEKKESFSRNDFVYTIRQAYKMTDPQIAYDLQRRLDEGSIVHVGWNKYVVAGRKGLYRPVYSNEAEELVQRIMDGFIDMSFRVFELIQLNDFMNHQIAHNTIFLQVENDLQEFVFDTLRVEYPGRVMLRPGLAEYYRYLQDNEIVVGRLPSEAPKGVEKPWHSRLEKIIVDIYTDKLLRNIVPESEKETIVTGAFDLYLLDEKTMIRYAKRKGAADKVGKILKEYGVSEEA